MKTRKVDIRECIINALVRTIRHWGLDAHLPEGSEQFGYAVQIAGAEDIHIHFRQRIMGQWYCLDASLKIESIRRWTYGENGEPVANKISESRHHHPDCQCSICVHGADAWLWMNRPSEY